MIRLKRHRWQLPGVSLMETVVAVGVLAIAVPLALAAMTKAGSVGNVARAETRAPAIAERCLIELKAARRGESEFVPQIQPAASFPAGDEVIVLGFSREGRLLGSLDLSAYEAGYDEELGGEEVSYLADVSGRYEDESVTVTVKIEYPAVRREGDRSEIEFHTKLP
ncbi:MAG: type IV pilus modification PilV family protein [Haloferula sp.]